jgi:hypothetical protein
MSYVEPIAAIEQHTVEDVAFSSSILSCDRDYVQIADLKSFQELECWFCYEGICVGERLLLFWSKAMSWTARFGC